MKKKSALPVRKKEKLNVDCSDGCGVRATFYCARCNKAFCDQCIGLKDRSKSYCIHCAAVLHTNKSQEESESSDARRLGLPLKVLLILIITSVFFYLITVFDDQQIDSSADYLLTPMSSTEEKALIACKEKLVRLSILVEHYQRSHGSDPEELDDVVGVEADFQLLVEPVDEFEYGLEQMPNVGLVISCPNPSEHRLDALYIIPGSSSVMME